MSNFSIKSFDHCILTAEGCSVVISDDSTNPDGVQLFLHPLNTRFTVPGDAPKLIMTKEAMLEKCRTCEQFGHHNPTTAIQEVTIRICGQLCKFSTGGILISGPITNPVD